MALHERGDDTRREILAFIKSYWRVNKSSPTFREVVQGTSISTTSVLKHHLKVMEDEGTIIFKENKSRGMIPAGLKIDFENVKP